jgi:ferritin-like metal-binding protein YciE
VSKYFPKIIKNSCNYELIEALYIHQNESQKQVIRIEESFELLKEQSLLVQNAAIDTLLSELDNAIEITKFGMIRDAGIILSLHKIEHYEIASYSILTLFAENLKEKEIFELLDKSLNEEKVAQMRLAKITNTIQFHPPEVR